MATFKKTVAMHEVFLTRLAAHPMFRKDSHLRVFLEYAQDLCAKPKRKMDILGGFVSPLSFILISYSLYSFVALLLRSVTLLNSPDEPGYSTPQGPVLHGELRTPTFLRSSSASPVFHISNEHQLVLVGPLSS